MIDYEIDTLVEAANPLDEAALQALALDDVEQALCDALVLDAADRAPGRGAQAPPAGRGPRAARRRGAEAPPAGRRPWAAPGHGAQASPAGRRPWAAPGHGAQASPAGRRPRRGRLRRGPLGRRLLAGVALAAVVALGLVVVTGGSEPGDSGVAWAAPLVRLAESSPLLLLDEPGWHVTRADEYGEGEGEMTFTLDAADADLHWRGGSLEQWQKDRAHSASRVVRRTVLGQPAQISQYANSTDFAAVWPDGERVLEFRTVTADLEAFERLLGSLKRVDVDTWLSAMPASVVKAANRGNAIKAMLADIPLPPGFDISKLENEPTLSDRYQLGANVTGAVACGWLKRWVEGRRSGDDVKMRQAVDALRTSRTWDILLEMKSGGDWPKFIWMAADALRDGERRPPGKAPIEQVIGGGMGCNER